MYEGAADGTGETETGLPFRSPFLADGGTVVFSSSSGTEACCLDVLRVVLFGFLLESKSSMSVFTN